MDGAIAAFQANLKVNPKHAETHNNLGNALNARGRREEAIRAYRAAVALNGSFAGARYNLGCTLWNAGDLEGAHRELEKVVTLQPGNAVAHCYLGLVAQAQGRFTAALRSLKAGHDLGARQRGWPYPSAEWVRLAERLAEWDALLPKVLSGEAQPKDAPEALGLARLCQEHKKRPAAAARFYGAAFALDPRLADDHGGSHRYNAACAAALAGCGRGADATTVADPERARLRKQALDWLRAELAYHAKLADGAAAEVRAFVQKRLRHWLTDADLAGVRGEALTRLPEAEGQLWGDFWAEVGQTLGQMVKN
jgi:serine/threonine-protein kinase